MSIKRSYRFDKASGSMVEITPDGEKAIARQLAKDARLIRRGMKPLKQFRSPKYPITPEPLGIEPEDIPQAMETAKAHGVPTEYTKTGEPLITSADHLRRYNRAFGFYERNSYDSPVNR